MTVPLGEHRPQQPRLGGHLRGEVGEEDRGVVAVEVKGGAVTARPQRPAWLPPASHERVVDDVTPHPYGGRMGVRRRVWSWVERGVGRYPRQSFVAGLVLPWALFALAGTPETFWFPVWDLAVAVGAAGGVVGGIVRFGVRPGKWPVALAIYAVAVNLGIAEFAYVYWSSSVATPSAFSEVLSKVDAAYFSWTTFTTTGFDDIAARGESARLAVTGEMALTFVAVAGGLAVLLGSRRNVDG